MIDAKGKVIEMGVSASACPYVYLETRPGDFTYVGEILRNRNRRSLEATQDLPLATPETQKLLEGAIPGTIRIRIAEEKPERTFLDAVFLVVGNQEISPQQCSDDSRPHFCADDGLYTIIEPGQKIELSFEVAGLNVEQSAVKLRANGFYKPIPKHLIKATTDELDFPSLGP